MILKRPTILAIIVFNGVFSVQGDSAACVPRPLMDTYSQGESPWATRTSFRKFCLLHPWEMTGLWSMTYRERLIYAKVDGRRTSCNRSFILKSSVLAWVFEVRACSWGGRTKVKGVMPIDRDTRKFHSCVRGYTYCSHSGSCLVINVPLFANVVWMKRSIRTMDGEWLC